MRRERPVRLCSAHPARHESDHDPSGLPSVVSYAELLLSGPRPRRGGRPRGPRGILLGRRVPGARGDGAAQPGSRRRLADPGDGSRGRWPGPIVLSAGHGGVPLWRLLRGERRPVGSDPHMVRRGIRPRDRSRMGHLHPPGPDQGHAHPELFARFGSRAGFRPAAPLRSRRDREFHLDRAATDDLPRRPGDCLAHRFEFHRSLQRHAIPHAYAGGCESTRGRKPFPFGVPGISHAASGHNWVGIGRIGILHGQRDDEDAETQLERDVLRGPREPRESNGPAGLPVLRVLRVDGRSGGDRIQRIPHDGSASVRRGAFLPELEFHSGLGYDRRDCGRLITRLRAPKETTVQAAARTGLAAPFASRRSESVGGQRSAEEPAAARAVTYFVLSRRYSTESKTHRPSPFPTHSVSWNSILIPRERFVQPATNPATKGHAGFSRRPSRRAAKPIAVPSGNRHWTNPVTSSYSISDRPHPAPESTPFPDESSRTCPSFARTSLRSRALTSAPSHPELYPTK